MGNVIYSDDFCAVSATLSSSELAGFPDENVSSITYPHVPWKADGGGIEHEWVGIDLGSAQSVAAIVVDNINVVAVRIQGDSAADFNSGGDGPNYDSGELVVFTDERDGRAKLFHACSASMRYWRVYVESTVTSDGNPLKVGSICALDTYVTLSANPGTPYDLTVKEPILNEGTGEPVAIGHPYLHIGLNSTNYDDATGMESDIFTMLNISRAQPLVLYENNSDTSQVYIVHRVGDTKWSRPGPRHGRFSSLIFREVGETLAA